MRRYVAIADIAVQTANVRPVWWVVSAAPVVPAVQFAHALGRAAGALPTGIHLIHHDAQHLGEPGFDYGRYAPQQRRGAMLISGEDYASGSKPRNASRTLKGTGTLSLQPTATAHLSLSLVLEFDASAFSSGWQSDLLDKFLEGARFAGGQIIKPPKLEEHDNLESALRQIGRGFLIADRRDLLEGRPDPLAALMEALYPEQEENRQPWLCPTNLGYILAEEPRMRHGARQGFLHAWGEPLAGLVQFQSLRTALRGKKRPVPWSAHWLNEFTWVVQQKGA
jgi:CRISPR-associated protein Csy2